MPFSTDLPDPPVPADCDLRSYAFYPLFLDRLLGSWFHRCATPVEWKAGLLLWMKSWREVPAGSLPADDRELAALAEVPLRTWLKVKPVSLHGWELHSDGRLYHPVVTEVTVRAQTQRQGFVARGRAGAEARWANSSEHGSKHGSKHGPKSPADTKLEKGQESLPETPAPGHIPDISAPYATPADGSKHGSENGSADGNIRERRKKVGRKEPIGSSLPTITTSEANASSVVGGASDASAMLAAIEQPSPRGSRFNPELVDLPADWADAAMGARMRAGLPGIDLALEWEKFRNFWIAKAGKDGTKRDWRLTWINWTLNANPPRNGNGGTPLANLFEGAWRAANERERREQERDRGTDSGPVDPLLEQH